MAALVLKNVPPETHRWLKEEAVRNRRSMTQQAMQIIEEARAHRLPPLPPPFRVKTRRPFTQAWLRKAIEEGRE